MFFLLPFYGQISKLLHERKGFVFPQKHAEMELFLASPDHNGVGEYDTVGFVQLGDFRPTNYEFGV